MFLGYAQLILYRCVVVGRGDLSLVQSFIAFRCCACLTVSLDHFRGNLHGR